MPSQNWSAVGETTVSHGVTVRAFLTLHAAVVAYGPAVARAARRFRDGELAGELEHVPTTTFDLNFGHTELVFRDELGLALPLWRVVDAYGAAGLPAWPFGYRARRRFGWTFREDPVPGTGQNWKFCYYFRSIRTTAERREAAAMIADDELVELNLRPRARRGVASLPSAYDDIGRGRQRCWKKQRRTQWTG